MHREWQPTLHPTLHVQTNLQSSGGLGGLRIDGAAAGLVNIQGEQRGETEALGFCRRGLFEIQQVETQAEQESVLRKKRDTVRLKDLAETEGV